MDIYVYIYMDSNPICHPSPAKQNEMLIFGLRSTSDDQPGWSMDLNPICHPSLAKKVKCSFLDCIQLLMIGRAGRWTRIPSTTPLQPKNWNAHFWITFNFWWSARLVNGLEPHLPPLSSQKCEMLIFGLSSTSDDRPGWSMDSNPICHPSPAKKVKCSFLDYVQLLMIGQAGHHGLESRPPPLSSQKIEMLIFGLCSTSDDQPGWSSWTFYNLPHPLPLPYSDSVPEQETGKCSISNGLYVYIWSLDSNPICHPSPAKKVKCSFLDCIQLLMIGQAGRWTRTPSTTPLQPKIWNAHFWITFNFWWSAGLVDGLEPCPPPLSSQKVKCSFLDYIQLLMIGRAGQWTWTPSATPL